MDQLRDGVTETSPALNRETEGSNPSLAANREPQAYTDFPKLQSQFDLWKLITWEPPQGLRFSQVATLLTVEQFGHFSETFESEPSLRAGNGEQLYDHRTVKAFLLWWSMEHDNSVAPDF